MMDAQTLPDDWDRRFRTIWDVLGRLLKRSGAAIAVLMDTAGNAVTYWGEEPDFDLLSFSPLAVGDFLAGRELASVLGESSTDWVVHQSGPRGLLMAPLHHTLILAVLFDRRSSLGIVRYETLRNLEALREATASLARLLDRQMHEGEEEHGEAGDLPAGEDEAVWIEQQLDQLFGPQV